MSIYKDVLSKDKYIKEKFYHIAKICSKYEDEGLEVPVLWFCKFCEEYIKYCKETKP